jgi:hypothetical protein
MAIPQLMVAIRIISSSTQAAITRRSNTQRINNNSSLSLNLTTSRHLTHQPAQDLQVVSMGQVGLLS